MFAFTTFRDLLSRAGRNAAQVVAPVLLLAATTGSVTGVDWLTVADMAACAALVTVVKAGLNLQPDPASPPMVQAVERALPAAAGSLLGFMTASGFSLIHADYRMIGVAVAGSFLSALLHLFVDPPAQSHYGLAA